MFLAIFQDGGLTIFDDSRTGMAPLVFFFFFFFATRAGALGSEY